MYIPPFLAGFLAAIFLELALLFVWAVISKARR